jgi:phage I-like protein
MRDWYLVIGNLELKIEEQIANGSYFSPIRDHKQLTTNSYSLKNMIMLSPLGDFPHARGMQRIDAKSVAALVEDFGSLRARLGRLFVGVPFYIGHPDVPGLEKEYPDRKAYGWVMALAQKEDGLYANVKWSKAGKETIAEGHYRFLSPYWSAMPVADGSGEMIYRPNKLLSVGLTNNPNLPVLPLENAARGGEAAAVQWMGQVLALGGLSENAEEGIEGAEAVGNDEFEGVEINNEKENNMNQDGIVKQTGMENRGSALTVEAVLSLLGLPGTATIDEVKKRLEPDSMKVLPTNRAGDGLENGNLSQRAADGVPADWLGIQSRVQRLEVRLINSVVDQAIREGRATPAQRGFWSSQLAEDFDGKSVALANAAKVAKTDSRSENFKAESLRQSEQNSRSNEVLGLVRTKMEQGLNYDQAWMAVKEENQNLFAMMEQPGNPAQGA